MTPSSWPPRDLPALNRALNDGLLDAESTFLELKQQPPPTKSNRKASTTIAIDLASLSVHGGLLIYGVAERKGKRPTKLTPVDLNGLADRIQSIALSQCDPPLVIATTHISEYADNGSNTGYLLIHVPASESAPHMADGKYRSRADARNIVLTDADVERLIRRRDTTEAAVSQELEEWETRDPVRYEMGIHLPGYDTGFTPQNGHLLMCAVPLRPPHEMMKSVTHTSEWGQALATLVVPSLEEFGDREHPPSLLVGRSPYRLDDGVGMSYGLREDRTPQNDDDPEWAVDLQVSESGVIRMFHGTTARPNGGRLLLDTGSVAIRTRQVIALAVTASEHADYWGSWGFGIVITGIRGAYCGLIGSRRGRGFTSYKEEEYRKTVVVSHTELAETPHLVGEKLVGRLLRSLDQSTPYQDLLAAH